ncbi:MAG: hypothetical protein E6Q97_30490 [Desulfurellales bacterium]|nr:MAG: hypothetical protein E6Q97_30490 [Desulfurellales bacterium]
MGLFGGSKFDKAFREYEMPKEPGFWQGGEKFRGKDGIAGLLAVIGDAIAANHGSGSMGATQSLMGGRFDAMEEAKKRAKEQEQLQQKLQAGIAAGWTPQEANALVNGFPQRPKLTPESIEDNVGNRWVKNAQGEWQLDFIDKAPVTTFQNGMMVNIQNPYADRSRGYTEGATDMGVPIPSMAPNPLADLQAERVRRRLRRQSRDFLGGR